jgi:hypothetical protein
LLLLCFRAFSFLFFAFVFFQTADKSRTAANSAARAHQEHSTAAHYTLLLASSNSLVALPLFSMPPKKARAVEAPAAAAVSPKPTPAKPTSKAAAPGGGSTSASSNGSVSAAASSSAALTFPSQYAGDLRVSNSLQFTLRAIFLYLNQFGFGEAAKSTHTRRSKNYATCN